MFIDNPNFFWRKFTPETAIEQQTNSRTKISETEKIAKLFAKEKPNSVLLHDSTLPEGIDRLSDDFINTPLCEIDPFYRDKFTYLVLRKNFDSRQISLYRYSSEKSLNLLSPFNPLRQICIAISSSYWFSTFIFLTILANCVFLALDLDQTVSENSDLVFTIIYIIEFFIRLFAQGAFQGSHTYFRDPWQWLDFLVIMISVITYIIKFSSPEAEASSSFTSFRTFRVLRALKSLSIVPGLRTIVSALLACINPMTEVLFIMVFLILTIAILGMQSYSGVLRSRCVDTNIVNMALTTDFDKYQENSQILDKNNWYHRKKVQSLRKK